VKYQNEKGKPSEKGFALIEKTISQPLKLLRKTRYIAVSTTAAIRAGNDDITSSESIYFRRICWRYLEKFKRANLLRIAEIATC
jgi:hypothetical protein